MVLSAIKRVFYPTKKAIIIDLTQKSNISTSPISCSNIGFFRNDIQLTPDEQDAKCTAAKHLVIYKNGIAQHNITNSQAPRCGPNRFENHEIDGKNIVMWPKSFQIRDHVIDKKGELSHQTDKKIAEKHAEITERTKNSNNEDDI